MNGWKVEADGDSLSKEVGSEDCIWSLERSHESEASGLSWGRWRRRRRERKQTNRHPNGGLEKVNSTELAIEGKKTDPEACFRLRLRKMQ